MKRSLAAVAIAVAAGCAGAPAPHTRQQPTSVSHPEPDPSCRGNLSQCLTVTGLEQVIVKVGVTAEGKVAFIDVLTPDLTAEDTVEVRRALEGCVWKPAVGPNGERVERTFTMAIKR